MGLGYIGLPTAIIAAKHGIEIVGVDINPQVVEMTNAGHLHFMEPGMEEMLQEVIRSGNFHEKHVTHISLLYRRLSKGITYPTFHSSSLPLVW